MKVILMGTDCLQDPKTVAGIISSFGFPILRTKYASTSTKVYYTILAPDQESLARLLVLLNKNTHYGVVVKKQKFTFIDVISVLKNHFTSRKGE